MPEVSTIPWELLLIGWKFDWKEMVILFLIASETNMSKHFTESELETISNAKRFKQQLNDKYLNELNEYMQDISGFKMIDDINYATRPFENNNISSPTTQHLGALKRRYDEANSKQFHDLEKVKLDMAIQQEQLSILLNDKSQSIIRNVFADLANPIKSVGLKKYGAVFDLEVLNDSSHPDYKSVKGIASAYLDYLKLEHQFPQEISLSWFIDLLLSKANPNCNVHSGNTRDSINQYLNKKNIQMTQDEVTKVDVLLRFNSSFRIGGRKIYGKGHRESEFLKSHFSS
eukprot:NODE_67_length_25542_cov_1.476831.p10 type:complete len:287 gc:universal NODE_67_length_25542_cov_1.476831:11916-12776(+)